MPRFYFSFAKIMNPLIIAVAAIAAANAVILRRGLAGMAGHASHYISCESIQSRVLTTAIRVFQSSSSTCIRVIPHPQKIPYQLNLLHFCLHTMMQSSTHLACSLLFYAEMGFSYTTYNNICKCKTAQPILLHTQQVNSGFFLRFEFR